MVSPQATKSDESRGEKHEALEGIETLAIQAAYVNGGDCSGFLIRWLSHDLERQATHY